MDLNSSSWNSPEYLFAGLVVTGHGNETTEGDADWVEVLNRRVRPYLEGDLAALEIWGWELAFINGRQITDGLARSSHLGTRKYLIPIIEPGKVTPLTSMMTKTKYL